MLKKFTLLLTALASFAMAAAAHAQAAWPSAKPVSIIVPFSAGGSLDATTRLVAQRLAERLGQSVVVDNATSAGGVVGMSKAIAAAPDGYSLLMAGDSPFVSPVVAGRQVDLALMISASALPLTHSKAIKALAVTGDTRLASLPDVPTVAETIGFKGFNVVSWAGLYAPAKTPPAVVQRLAQEISEVLNTEAVRNKLMEQAIVPRGGTPSEFIRFIEQDRAQFTQVLKTVSLNP